jgi:hypothetical protein
VILFIIMVCIAIALMIFDGTRGTSCTSETCGYCDACVARRWGGMR